MALVSWSRVRAALIDDLGGIGTHEAVVVAVNQRPNLSGVLELNKGKGQEQRARTETKADGRRCISLISLSKYRDLNIRAEVLAPLGNQAHKNKRSMNITVTWLATRTCK
jgi:folate-binding Fe-S cluster repair protein YgfZ